MRLLTTLAVVVGLAAAAQPGVASATTTNILVPSVIPGGSPARCTLNSSELYQNRTGTRVAVDVSLVCPTGTSIGGTVWIQDPNSEAQLGKTNYAGTGSAWATASAACQAGRTYQAYVYVHVIVPGAFIPYELWIPGLIVTFDCPYG